jgi:hypothetical protein
VGRLCRIERLTTYHARHTWATLARNEVGVTLGDVGEALNHSPRGSERVTDIYVERDFTRVWDTNRKVLDLLKLRENFQRHPENFRKPKKKCIFF